MPDAPAPVDLDTAFSEGSKATQQIFDNYRHNLAMNALAKQYGPTAFDPEAAKAAQENYLNSQIDPMKIQEAARQNAAGAAAVDQYGPQAGNPDAYSKNVGTAGDIDQQQRAAQIRVTNLMAQTPVAQRGAVFDQLVAPNAQAWGIDPAHVGPYRAMLTDPTTSDQTLAHAVSSLQSAAPVTGTGTIVQNPDGSYSRAMTTKEGGQVTQQLSGTPVLAAASQQRANASTQNADTNTAKLPILQQNANTQSYSAGVRGANQTYGPQSGQMQPGQPGQPTPQALDKLIATKGVDRAIAEAGSDKLAQAIADRAEQTMHPQQAQANGLPAASPLDRLPPKGRQLAIGQATQIANQATNLHTVNTILDQVMQQISPYTTGAGSLLSELPGSAQTDLKANLQTLSAQGLTAWIQSLKNQSGQTGIGRVLQSEANAAMKLYGNMEQDQSAKQLAFHAGLFRQSVNALYQHSQDAYKAQWGTDPMTALGHPPPAASTGAQPPPGLNLPPGFKYIGPAQ